jgi:hypothetical protein
MYRIFSSRQAQNMVHCKLGHRHTTKGKQLKICTADQTPRETLEKRLEKTPSNARCFAQGSSLMCLSILESLMGTAHGAEELPVGLCPPGLACQAGGWGRYIGFCSGY